MLHQSHLLTSVSLPVPRRTAAMVLGGGSGLIAISIYGRDPGYGILSMYLVFTLNLSIMALFTRLVVVCSLIVAYLVSTHILNKVSLHICDKQCFAFACVRK